MKLLRSGHGKFVFHLDPPEKQLLLAVLRRYPAIPPAYQPLSKSARSKEDAANQRLLEEALAEQRAENKRQLEKALRDGRRFKTVECGCHLTLSASDFAWLLQMLNDVRVGSWISLGSPDENRPNLEVNAATAPHPPRSGRTAGRRGSPRGRFRPPHIRRAPRPAPLRDQPYGGARGSSRHTPPASR